MAGTSLSLAKSSQTISPTARVFVRLVSMLSHSKAVICTEVDPDSSKCRKIDLA